MIIILVRPVIGMDPGFDPSGVPVFSAGVGVLAGVGGLTVLSLHHVGSPASIDCIPEIIRLMVDSGSIDVKIESLRSAQGGMRIVIVRLLVEAWSKMRTQYGSQLPNTQRSQWNIIET